jgi:hypothetical protein
MRVGRIGRAMAVAVGAACLVALLAACEPNYAVKRTEVNLAVPCNGTTNVNAEWAIPEGVTPTGFIWLQHGFARSNDAMIDLQTKYSSRGWIVVSPTMSAFGTCAINAAVLHTAVANLLVGSTGGGSALEAQRGPSSGFPPPTSRPTSRCRAIRPAAPW